MEYLRTYTVNLQSKGFQGTASIFPIDGESLKANMEINKIKYDGTKNDIPLRRISLPVGSLRVKVYCTDKKRPLINTLCGGY